MSSTINTNSIDVNYPIPGQNNNTQGFRNNFTAIKTNLDTAGSEISDLENKVVLKSALANSTLNNDMANTLISNASTLGFRATTYNLGNALSGTIVVDCALGDVQYGNLSGNITLQFGSWAPTGTQSKIQLQLGRANANTNFSISFPTEAIVDNNHGFVLLENFSTPNSVPTVSFPYDVTQLNLQITSNDCGNSLFVEPTNRPFISTQIQTGTPPSTGKLGDVVGTVYVDPGTTQLVVTNTTSTITLSGVTITGTGGQFSCTATTRPLAIGQAVTISGTFGGTGSITGYSDPTTYYIIATNGSSTFTLSATLGGSAIVTTAGTPTGLTYVVNADLLVTSNTSSLYTGLPVVFTGTSLEANVVVGSTYYVRNVISSNTFTISSAPNGANIDISSNVSGTNMIMNPIQYMYVSVGNFDADVQNITILSTTSPNLITLPAAVSSYANMQLNNPVIFTGNITSNTGISLGEVYYINSISSSNFTISKTTYNGLAGPEFTNINTVSNANIDLDFDVYNGSDIFRRIELLPFIDVSSDIAASNVTIQQNLLVGGNTTIQGNLTVNGTYTYENVSTLAVEDPIVGLGRGANNTALISDDNKDRGLQLWYYSGSEKSSFIGWDDSQQKLIAAANVSVSSEVVTVNSYGNIVLGGVEANTLSSNTTLSVLGNANIGNLGTTGQIISVGNITTSANIIGNVLASNLDVAGTATIATVNDIKIGGGLNGYYLVTDGTGNLSWVSGGGSGSGVVGGANTQIQFNNGTGSFAGAAGFTFDSVTNVMSVPGNVGATGNISASYFIGNGSQLSGLAFSIISNGTSNVSIPVLSGNVLLSAAGNANILVVTGTGSNINGTLNVTGNANVGNLGTAGLIVATGNVTGGNLVTGGALSVTGNANVGNIGAGAGVFSTIAGSLTTAAQPNVTSTGTLTSLGVSGNTTTNNLISNNYVIISVANSITAAGTVQADATQLSKSINVVTTVPAGSGVKLPVAEAGMRIIVRNSTSTALNVYPNTGAAIEPALANAPYTLNATTSMEFFCSAGGASGQWYTLF